MAKTALMTGCSSGIGRATARTFLADDWTVYATARDPADVESLAERGAETAALDVRDGEAVEAVVDGLLDAEGRLDCLVNNAGYGQFGAVEDVPTEALERQFDVNVLGPHRLIRAVVPVMRSQGSGRVINVASVDDRLPLPGTGAYSGSKFALRALSDALRQELHGTDMEVSIVEPGLVATEFYVRAVEELARVEQSPAYDDLYRVLESVEALSDAAVGVGDPEDVAGTILTAASEEPPDPFYRVAPLASVGAVAAELLRGRLRDRVTDSGVSLLADDWLTELAGYAES